MEGCHTIYSDAMAYLFKVGIVEPEEQPLLGNCCVSTTPPPPPPLLLLLLLLLLFIVELTL
jgi:MYXO-CTERM domain-containing protein